MSEYIFAETTAGHLSQFTPGTFGGYISAETATNHKTQFTPVDPSYIIYLTTDNNTNVNSVFTDIPTFVKSGVKVVAQSAVQSLASIAGFPQIINLDTNKQASGFYVSKYTTLPYNLLNHKFTPAENGKEGIDNNFRFSDFRAKLPYNNLINRRFDGASALIRGGWIGGLYAAASASPAGAYSVFNIMGNKYFGAGLGDEGNPGAIINDFTMRSHVATKWKSDPSLPTKGTWEMTTNPIELITAFRGDKVTVIDFGKRLEGNAYAWNPVTTKLLEKAGKASSKILGSLGAGLTQDFIKFYFTGPTLFNGYIGDVEDDVIVFRASITSLNDSFTANWAPISLIGRGDPNYQYTGYSRDVNLDFMIIATDRDELKPIWRKLNAMAGYTAPEYDPTSIALKAPWVRITIGDLFRQQPAILTSLSYTLQDNDTSWEINIERDPTMKQVPRKISVSCTFTMVTDYIPQKGGRFYTLADKFNASGSSGRGDHNWLSDFPDNVDIVEEKRKRKPKVAPAGETLKASFPAGSEGGKPIQNDPLDFLELPK